MTENVFRPSSSVPRFADRRESLLGLLISHTAICRSRFERLNAQARDEMSEMTTKD